MLTLFLNLLKNSNALKNNKKKLLIKNMINAIIIQEVYTKKDNKKFILVLIQINPFLNILYDLYMINDKKIIPKHYDFYLKFLFSCFFLPK